MKEQANKMMKLEILHKYIDKESFDENEMQWMDENDWHPVDKKQLKPSFVASVEKAKREKAKKLSSIDELFA